MGPAMARLSSRLPPAFLAPAPLSGFTGQSIGRRRFGRVCRVLFAQRQLALQIRDLLLGIRDLLLGIRDLPLLFGDLFGLTVDLLFPFSQLSAKPFVLPFQVARPQVAMPRTHPPYGSRSRAICPAKSAGVLELLPPTLVYPHWSKPVQVTGPSASEPV